VSLARCLCLQDPRLVAAIQAESAPSTDSRAFESVTGLSNFAVGVLNRIGIMKLYPSQRHVLEFLKVKSNDGHDTNYNKVIIAPSAVGKSTLLAFSAFVTIMSSHTIEPAASGAEQSSAPDQSTINPPSSDIEPAGSDTEPAVSAIEFPALDQTVPGVEPPSTPDSNGQRSSVPCKPRVLIVCPVHKIANGIGRILDLLLELHGHRCATFIGGVPIRADVSAMRKWPTAVVGTPGRLLDHMQHNRLDLSEVVYCAVDEVDTFGRNTSFRAFFDAMNDNLPECQITAVSSRMTMEVVAPVKALLKPNSPLPTIIRMGRNPQDLIRTEEVWFRLSADEFNSLPRWLHEHPAPEEYSRDKSIIFVETRKGVETFYKKYVNDLKSLNIEEVDSRVRFTHGGRREAERDHTLEEFRKGKFAVLFTTHMLAKGVNIPDVEVAYHIHPISDISTYREANARIGRDAKKAFIFTLFGAEDEALIQTHKTTFNAINGSSLVIDGESIESNDVPVVTASAILEALAGWDVK
jgi:hypothetical protein